MLREPSLQQHSLKPSPLVNSSLKIILEKTLTRHVSEDVKEQANALRLTKLGKQVYARERRQWRVASRMRNDTMVNRYPPGSVV